jgi:hypothetical protein
MFTATGGNKEHIRDAKESLQLIAQRRVDAGNLLTVCADALKIPTVPSSTTTSSSAAPAATSPMSSAGTSPSSASTAKATSDPAVDQKKVELRYALKLLEQNNNHFESAMEAAFDDSKTSAKLTAALRKQDEELHHWTVTCHSNLTKWLELLGPNAFTVLLRSFSLLTHWFSLLSPFCCIEQINGVGRFKRSIVTCLGLSFR